MDAIYYSVTVFYMWIYPVFYMLQKREREFLEYLQEKKIQAKADYRELLKETKQITYKSKKQMDDTDQHMKDIEAVLVVRHSSV